MSCYLRLWRAPSYEKAWTESPRGSPPLLRLLPHLSPEANPCKPGGRPSVSRTKEGLLESPPVARSNALSRPGTGECRSFQGARGFGARVLRGHSLKGRAQTSTLATPRYDQPGMRTSFQALGGIPSPRPFVSSAACGTHAVHPGPVRREEEEKSRAQKVCAWQRWGVGGQQRPGNLVGGAEGGLSPPAALNSVLCGSPGGSIADFIDWGSIDFVLESPPHP